MKTFNVKMIFIGLCGKYESIVQIRAKNRASAERKAYAYVGNRDLDSLVVL